MAIPEIAPYEIPAPPASGRVDWTPEPHRAALLVHDMQRYFVDAYRPGAEPISTVVANIARLAAAARACGAPVVFTAQPGDQHPHRRGLLRAFWGEGMAYGPATAIVDALAPEPGDIVVTKWRYSGFERTDLRDLLARAGRDQLLVTGVYAHLGCQVTSVDAFMADVQPFLVADAVADFSAAEHAAALDYVATGCGRVLDTAATLEALAPARPLVG